MRSRTIFSSLSTSSRHLPDVCDDVYETEFQTREKCRRIFSANFYIGEYYVEMILHVVTMSIGVLYCLPPSFPLESSSHLYASDDFLFTRDVHFSFTNNYCASIRQTCLVKNIYSNYIAKLYAFNDHPLLQHSFKLITRK